MSLGGVRWRGAASAGAGARLLDVVVGALCPPAAEPASSGGPPGAPRPLALPALSHGSVHRRTGELRGSLYWENRNSQPNSIREKKGGASIRGGCPTTTSSRRHPTPPRATKRRLTTPNATSGPRWPDSRARTVPPNLSELCHSSTCMMTFRSPVSVGSAMHSNS